MSLRVNSGALAVLVAAAALAPAREGEAARRPVLHERYEPSASEDALLSATTLDGLLPAAIVTRSGTLSAPRAKPPGQPPSQVYGSEAASGAEAYQADGDPRRPDLVSYGDPFTPSIPPFKRLHAYDAVGAAFELVVARPALSTLDVGGTARVEDDQFYGDFTVRLLANTPARIPSVGPGARVLVARAIPAHDFALFHDGADNWFVQSPHNGSLQLTVHLAIDRRSFGSDFAATSWSALARDLPSLPVPVVDAAREVAREIGVEPDAMPGEVVAALVAHFRSFEPSTEPLVGEGEQLYRELSVAKRGVCRHRAYGFAVTALGLGVPTRFVHNEAHAWVEVFDSRLWHRIDLGGAAANVSLDGDERPTHVEPEDPYRWPASGGSARAMMDRARRERASGAGTAQSQAVAQQSTSTDADLDSPQNEPNLQPTPGAPPATLSIAVQAERVQRGARLQVSGEVQSDGEPCDQVRVDIAIRRGASDRHVLGTLVSDARGRYRGHVVVPFSVPVGDYQVEATTPGRSGMCGPGQTR